MPGPDARALTLEHQLHLAAASDELARQVKRIATRADGSAIDAWWLKAFPKLIELVAEFFTAILGLTHRYLKEHAAAEGRDVDPVHASWSTEKVATSLRVMGPVAFKRSISNGRTPEQAIKAMTQSLSAAAVRQALEADRETLTATVEAGGEIIGWRRVPDADPCAFCAMLVSRGAVYESVGTAGREANVRFVGEGLFKFHDGCQCTAEPLYEHEGEPDGVKQLQDAWQEVTAGKSGGAAVRAWREWWDNRGGREELDMSDRELVNAPTAAPVEATDPALKLTVAQLKAIAKDNGIPLLGNTRKADIVQHLRDWARTYEIKIQGLPEWKPPRVTPDTGIQAPPLGVPGKDRVLSGGALNDWADYFRHDREQRRFHFVDANGNTPPEGIRVRDLRANIQGSMEYTVQDGTAWSFDGVAYLVEHRADQFGSPWVSRTLTDLRAAHADIPAAKLANKSYSALGGDNPADEYWRKHYNDPHHASAAMASGGHVTLWQFRGPYSRVNVDNIRHETGHNLDEIVGRETVGSESPAWKAAAKADVATWSKVTDISDEIHGHGEFAKLETGRGFPEGVTSYGRSAAVEDYAESVRLYQLGVIAQGRLTAGAEKGPVYFRDLYPERAKILDELFPDIAKAQKAEIKALRAPKPAVSDVDLSKRTVVQLRALAKERGIAGYSKLTKPQLLERLGKPSIPDLPPEHDLVIAARKRQADIDFARARATLLTEAEHWLDAEGSIESMRVQLRRDAKRLGIEGHKDVAPLFKALDTGDVGKVRKAIDAVAKKQKLARIESSGDVVPFDRTKHSALGSGVRDGQRVVVVRPGYTFDRNGESIRLHKATVEAATKAEIAKSRSLGGLFDREAATGSSHKVDPKLIEERLNGTYAGYRVEVKGARYVSTQGLRFNGTIYNADGTAIGSFARLVGRDGNGDLFATHELLKIKPKYQGSGFQAQFNGNLIDWYQSSGVKYIKVGANIDVGGYTWASAGYDYADHTHAMGGFGRLEFRLREILGEPKRQMAWLNDEREVPLFRWDGPIVWDAQAPWSRERLAKMFKGADDAEINRQIRIGDEFIKSLAGKRFGDDDFPTAYELSQLGRWPGAGKDDVWIGKAVTLGSSWLGIMRL